jgi:insulysin
MIHMLLSTTAVLMSAVSPMNSYTVIPDQSNLPLLNPDLSERQSVKLRLNNGLQALIISDPKADQSAVSVSVGAGSWNDPSTYPGMAHFCEHMLFMGTKKYPSENEFFTSVANYAGLANAFTAPNRTVYMFSAQIDGFLSLFDQFAHFFIDPLFNPTNIAREMHAVDQEFAKNIEHDGWREYMIFKETGNPDHPNYLFSTGNSETLGKIPQSALKKWHEQNYGAEKINVVVYSSLPLEKLKELVVQTYSQVPQSFEVAIDTSAPLSSPEQVGKITYIEPIQNKQSLTLSWELPAALSIDPTKSADMIAYALRRGQEYSLYEKLKEEELIDTMSVRVDEMGGKEHRFFQISLELTRQGIAKMEQTILYCFQAIKGIQETGIPLYLFEEKNKMATLNYEYQERQDPFDYIRNLGDTIGDESLATYPRETLLATQYDPKKIKTAAALLTPKTCAISLLASSEVTGITPDRKEKWLGAEYAIRPIPEKWLSQWQKAKTNPEIRLANPNPFIPDQLAILPAGPNIPVQIANDSIGTAYYVRASEFGVPDSIYHIHILSPEITGAAKSSVLVSLYIDHLTDMLHPTLAAANAAGLACAFDLSRGSLHFQISGYSDKAPLLLQEVAKQMPLNPPTEAQFAIYVDRHQKDYQNGEKELAVRQAKELLDSLLNQDKTTKQEKLAALKTITYEDFLAFHKNLFEKTYIEALFAGNLNVKQAESAWLDVIHVLGKSPFPKSEHAETKVLHLPENHGPYEISQNTDVQGNAAILLIDEGNFSYEKRAAQEILTPVVKEAFFNELRTTQKTGYIAQSDGLEIEERLFQIFLVQSNSHQPDDLLYRFEQFIEEFNDSLTHNISEERFETLKNSAISSLKTRFRNLQDKTALWDRLAFERDADFNFVENRITGLANLTYSQFKESATEFLSRKNRRRLAILFQGKLASPFAYEPITIHQLDEIATYVPRKSAKPPETAGTAVMLEQPAPLQ